MRSTHVRLDHHLFQGGGHRESGQTIIHKGPTAELQPSTHPAFPLMAEITCSSCDNTYRVGTYRARTLGLRFLILASMWLSILVLTRHAFRPGVAPGGSGLQISLLFLATAAMIATVYLVRTLHLKGINCRDEGSHRVMRVNTRP